MSDWRHRAVFTAPPGSFIPDCNPQPRTIGMYSNIKEAIETGTLAAGLIGTVTTSLKSILDLTRKPNPDIAEVKALAADAIDKLLEAKTVQMDMQQRLVDLENELRKRNGFRDQAERYVLERSELGGLYYTLKSADETGEPPHDLCASCFEDEVKAVLQPVNFNTLKCPKCSSTVLKPDGRSEARYGKIRTGFDVLDPYRDR
jgi:hypothetical protein